MGLSEKPIAVAGGGFSGATLARLLADAGYRCVVFDERNHVGGNCHTDRDPETDILVHRYGPHIFHTDDEAVWSFLGQFAEFVPYRHQVVAVSGGRTYSLPINLLTINQFFGTHLTPHEAEALVRKKTIAIAEPRNFEEQALATIGPDLYEAFFKHYTEKQWGMAAVDLPASILKRLPLRFTYDSNYFHHVRQAMPRHGYTELIATMLRHPRIELRLGQAFNSSDSAGYAHSFYTGMLDRYFEFSLGRLAYRTLDFETVRGDKVGQGTAVTNYTDGSTAWTRTTDHQYLSPWNTNRSSASICFREYPRHAGRNDTPYYPVHTTARNSLLESYVELAEQQQDVTFLGRLGNYAYLDMDAAVSRAMTVAKVAIQAFRASMRPPVFVHRPV